MKSAPLFPCVVGVATFCTSMALSRSLHAEGEASHPKLQIFRAIAEPLYQGKPVSILAEMICDAGCRETTLDSERSTVAALVISAEPVVSVAMEDIQDAALEDLGGDTENRFGLIVRLTRSGIRTVQQVEHPMLLAVIYFDGKLIGVGPLKLVGPFFALGMYRSEGAARSALSDIPGISLTPK